MSDTVSSQASTGGSEPAEKVHGEVESLARELADTRRALAAAERQLFELRAQRSAEMARLEQQTYWLERTRIDLDAWMRRRSVRLAYWLLSSMRRALRRIAGRKA
jgi:predicted  nucleic acid-binding Zn-ribbon protein